MTRPLDQNAKDAARFAAALEPLQALLKDPPLMTDVCRRAVEEAIRELEYTRNRCIEADKWLAECARILREEGETP